MYLNPRVFGFGGFLFSCVALGLRCVVFGFGGFRGMDEYLNLHWSEWTQVIGELVHAMGEFG